MSARTLTSAAYLSEWFGSRLRQLDNRVEAVDVRSVARASRGVSRETWLVEVDVRRPDGAGRERYVIRRDHEVGSVDPIPLRCEYEVYRRLAGSRVPVSRALWFEDDPEWSPDQRPAYVRTLVPGSWRLPFMSSSDPADDDRRIEASKEHLRKLALVHQTDWQALGFGEIFPVPDGPANVAANLIRWFQARLAEIQFEPSPVLAEGLDWLRHAAPAAPCVTLCKGTNGLGEEVWRDGEIVAMSDWELSCLAEPAYDFAQIQEMVPVIERDGRPLWGWDHALRFYEDLTGIPVTMERVQYYRSLYALPMFLFTHNAARQVHVRGNRLARFAWTSTEMLYQSQLRIAAAAGFGPGRDN